jgi:hypothetical protein
VREALFFEGGKPGWFFDPGRLARPVKQFAG